MYNQPIGKELYLLANYNNILHPLVKASITSRGIVVMGLTQTHKGMYTHAEKYAEIEGRQIDKTRGHLHFYDTTAPLNEYDRRVVSLGGQNGLRGGCSSTPPLDDLKGYMLICGLGFSVNEVLNTKIKNKYLKKSHFIFNLDNYSQEQLYIDTYLFDTGNKPFANEVISIDSSGNSVITNYEPTYDLQRFDYTDYSPNIIFTVRTH